MTSPHQLTRGRLSAWLLFLASAVLALSSCGLVNRHRNTDILAGVAPGDQPDKILYERAMGEIEHGRYDVGRLTLQTLLNTYPDSEFLSKAKLAIADSYYKQGGVSGLTEAEAEYKDFETFFPTAPEAPQAQFRAGMCHFRLMGKPDRDLTEAKLAQVEFKEFLLKYPTDRMMPLVKARLREVQEVLAQGEYEVAELYYLRQANKAAESRFEEIADDYPSFSKADGALWYLGKTYERLKEPQKAAPYYARILTEYPLSPWTDDAKTRLTALHEKVPKPTLAALQRAEADQTHRVHEDIFQKLVGMVSSSPNVQATRRGPVFPIGNASTQVEVAKGPQGGTGSASVIVAEPAGDTALNPPGGTPSKPAPETKAESTSVPPPTAESTSQSPSAGAKTQTASGAPSAQASENSASKEEATDPTEPPKKKKGRLHFLRKIVKPF